MNAPEVNFAGKFLGADSEGKHLLMVEVDTWATRTYAFQVNGAFVTELRSGGWLFVEGARASGACRRAALFDDGDQAESGARGLVALGVSLLTEADAEIDVESVGQAINNITATEQARSLAASRQVRTS